MDHPTRKVDSMSSLVAEMLLRDSDPGTEADATSSAARDALGLDMARLIEVRSSVAPSAKVPAKSHTAVWLLAALVFLAALAGAAFALSR